MATSSFPVTLVEGSRTIGPVAIPSGLTECQISINRDNWLDPAVTLKLTIDLSLDGGVTWNTPAAACVPFPVGLEAQGGEVVDKFGQVVHTSITAAPIPQVGNANRRVRALLTVAGGSIPTTVTITTS